MRTRMENQLNDNQTNQGLCRDCGSGLLTAGFGLFEYYDDNEGRGFWYCTYCGSNHVDVVFRGESIQQHDLLDRWGTR